MGKTAKKAASKRPAKSAAKAKSKAPAPKKAVKPAKKPASVAKKKTAPAKRNLTLTSNGVDKERFTLYGIVSSGPTYTVGLMLSLCKYPFSYIHINLREGQHKQPDYLVKNRYGQVPALRDGQTYYVQSASILQHLAEALKKFDSKTEVEKNRIREWLFWQWDKLAVPIFRLRSRARGQRQFGDEMRNLFDTEARAALAVLDHELVKTEWLVSKRPTIADIGVYGVLRYAPEANVDLSHYPHVLEWKARVEALPGFGTPDQILPMESRLT
jgi:glutathione S-transferase